MILHLAIRADWEQAKLSSNYPWSTRGISVADEGYTHCSYESQWKGVRDRFYSDLADSELVLLEIDETKLTTKLVLCLEVVSTSVIISTTTKLVLCMEVVSTSVIIS